MSGVSSTTFRLHRAAAHGHGGGRASGAERFTISESANLEGAGAFNQEPARQRREHASILNADNTAATQSAF